jgi:hypothetical protein
MREYKEPPKVVFADISYHHRQHLLVNVDGYYLIVRHHEFSFPYGAPVEPAMIDYALSRTIGRTGRRTFIGSNAGSGSDRYTASTDPLR